MAFVIAQVFFKYGAYLNWCYDINLQITLWNVLQRLQF